MVVDVHAHCVPEAALGVITSEGPSLGIELGDDRRVTVAGRALQFPLRADLTDRDARLAALDRAGIEVQVLSPWIDLTAYRLPPDAGVRWSRLLNEALAEEAAANRDRFRALGTAPLQSPKDAASELQYAVGELGMVGVEIGTKVGEVDLVGAGLDDFWETAAGLGCLVLLHPMEPLTGVDLSDRFLHNIVGRPAESTIAVSRLLLAGIFERHQGLNLCVVHGGGFLPYQIGRMQRGWDAKPEVVAADLKEPPVAALRGLYYDTVLGDPTAIRYLIDRVGVDRVLLGTDYPFEMGDPDPVETLDAVPDLTDTERNAVLSANVTRLFDTVG